MPGIIEDIFTYLFLATLGWGSGIFVNLLVDALPRTRKISASVCGTCGQVFSLADYLGFSVRGRCGHPRPMRQILVLIGYLWITCLLWYFPPVRLGFWFGWILSIYLGVVAVIDIEHRLILDPTSIAGAILGLLIGVARHGWLSTLIGGSVGFGVMLALYWIGERFAQWLARRRGEQLDEVALGFGDVNLAGIQGLLLGWPGVFAGIVLTILLGGVGGGLFFLVMKLRGKYQIFTPIPYGPYLVLAIIYLLYLLP